MNDNPKAMERKYKIANLNVKTDLIFLKNAYTWFVLVLFFSPLLSPYLAYTCIIILFMSPTCDFFDFTCLSQTVSKFFRAGLLSSLSWYL